MYQGAVDLMALWRASVAGRDYYTQFRTVLSEALRRVQFPLDLLKHSLLMVGGAACLAV